MLVIRTDVMEPWRNLAAESVLLSGEAPRRPILYLWSSCPSIVIGKNQNPWRECRVADAERDGVLVVRRFSGGGAVYHDEGNLNYSFLLPRTAYAPERQFGAVLSALASLGIRAEVRDRNSLYVGDSKVSGTAFCLRGEGALQHGTLLVSADLDRLRRYLGPSPGRFTTKAVASNPAPVANLSALAPAVDSQSLEEALVRAFAAEYGGSERAGELILDAAAMEEHRARYRSWDWVYGLTPRFQVTLTDTWRDRPLTMELDVEHGIIRSARVRQMGPHWSQRFEGCRLHSDDVRERLCADMPELGAVLADMVARL